MITFTQTEFIGCMFVLLVIITVISGNASYWKAKYETLDKERGNNEGWREEARFLRRLVNKEAAKEVEKEEY